MRLSRASGASTDPARGWWQTVPASTAALAQMARAAARTAWAATSARSACATPVDRATAHAAFPNATPVSPATCATRWSRRTARPRARGTACAARTAGADAMPALRARRAPVPSPNACLHNCGGHGRCQADGRCDCDVGFTGADCSTASQLSVCPSGCSARGLCGPDGSCICEPGFSGEACGRADDEAPPPEGAEGGEKEAAVEVAPPGGVTALLRQGQQRQRARQRWAGERSGPGERAADAGSILALLEVGSSVEVGAVSQARAEADCGGGGGGGGGGGVWSGVDLGKVVGRAKAQGAKDFAARAAADAQVAERAAMDVEAQTQAGAGAGAGADVAGGHMARVTSMLPQGRGTSGQQQPWRRRQQRQQHRPQS